MTNFDYISEQIKAGKMNAEQMEDFVFYGTLEELECNCSDCRKKFLRLRYVPLIKPCPFCDSTNIRVYQIPYSENFIVTCDDCNAQSGYHATEHLAIKSWNSIRREEENE